MILNCRLTKIFNKDSLAKTLGVTTAIITNILNNKDSYYNIFELDGRIIEEPIKELRLIHENIFKQLQRLALPTYVHSGRKAHSYITNACTHAKYRAFVLTTDINKFYKSTNKKHIASFFINKLNIPNNLSHIITNLLTYNDHIPTGSPASQLIAFFGYKQCFDEINRFCLKFGHRMSLYVDDITISSKSPINENIVVARLTKILSKYKLSLNDEKTLLFDAHFTKKVTGVLINQKGKLFAPEKSKHKYLNGLNSGEDIQVLFGYRTAIRAIEGANAFKKYDKKLKSMK